MMLMGLLLVDQRSSRVPQCTVPQLRTYQHVKRQHCPVRACSMGSCCGVRALMSGLRLSVSGTSSLTRRQGKSLVCIIPDTSGTCTMHAQLGLCFHPVQHE